MDALDQSIQLSATKPKLTLKCFIKNQIPESILNDPSLNVVISLLPTNYNLEIHKCIWRIHSSNAKCLILQLPKGLPLFSFILSDILISFSDITHYFILGDVMYGAYCVDDLLIHYNCLVPIDASKIPYLYVL